MAKEVTKLHFLSVIHNKSKDFDSNWFDVYGKALISCYYITKFKTSGVISEIIQSNIVLVSVYFINVIYFYNTEIII